MFHSCRHQSVCQRDLRYCWRSLRLLWLLQSSWSCIVSNPFIDVLSICPVPLAGIRELKIEHYSWMTTVGRTGGGGEGSGSCRWWIGSSTNRLARKKEIKIVNKHAATVESLIDGHRVKNVISWTSWSLSLRFFWWSDQWRRVSYYTKSTSPQI